MATPDWLTEFPELDRASLRDIRKTLDTAYRDFSREYGELIESFFDPLLTFLVWFEKTGWSATAGNAQGLSRGKGSILTWRESLFASAA